MNILNKKIRLKQIDGNEVKVRLIKWRIKMRKFLIAIMLIMTITFVIAQVQETTTGTTTSSYVTVYTVVFHEDSQGKITLKNTGSSSKDIQFQVLAYVHPDATESDILATADDLQDGETATININDTCYQVVVQVMYPTGGGASTYSCSYRTK